MNFIFSTTTQEQANAILNGQYIRVRPVLNISNLPTVSAKNIAEAISTIGAQLYLPPTTSVKPLRTLT